LEVLIHSKSDVEHEMEIVVPQEELKTHFEKGYREHAKKITMPGFRPGRVPLQMIRRIYGTMIEGEVIEKLANDLFKQALDERNIKPFGQPRLEDIDIKPDEPVSIKIWYETLPELVSVDFNGIQLERLKHEVTDEEVEEEINYLLKSKKILEETESADDDNFRVTCEIQMLNAEGEPVAGQKNENLVVDLDDEQLNRDLKAELLNMKAGDEKDVELSHVNKDGQDEVERAHLKVKKVERVTLPDLTDAFAAEATHGTYADLEALREGLRKELTKNWERRYNELLENELRNEIIRRNPFPVPSQVLDDMKDKYLEHLKERQPEKKLPENFDVTEYRKSIDGEVNGVARWIFLRTAILEKEKIRLEDEDVMEKAEEEAAKLNIDKERLIEYYKSSAQFSDHLLDEKLFRFLIGCSEVKDINDDDISHSPLAPFAEIPHDHDHDDDHDHHHHHGEDHDHDSHTESIPEAKNEEVQ
jgi:trigger factor